MPKFAANLTTLFREYPFTERFAQARCCGFSAVEFLWPYEYGKDELKRLLKENSLTLALFNTSGGDTSHGEWGRSCLIGREQDARDDIEQALDYAVTLDCNTVHMMSGVVEHPEERSLCYQVFLQNLRYAASRFARYGKKIVIEALCPEIKQNYLFRSQYETLQAVHECSCDNVYILLDTFHAQKVDGNLSYLIEKYKGSYGHVQIASLPDRHEPDHGEINYDYIFSLLDKVGYEGYIGCEYNPAGDTVKGLTWFDRYRRPNCL